MDTRAADGTAGLWLIDPTDITIVYDNPAGTFDPAGNSTVGWQQIINALVTSNVTVTTNNGTGGNGDITFDDPTHADATIDSTNAGTASVNTLTFEAARNIVVNDAITLRNIGTTNLNAGGDVIFNQSFITSDTVADATVSGHLNVTAGDDIFINSAANVGVFTGSGNVVLSANNGNGGNSAIEIDGRVRSAQGDITLNAQNYFVEVNTGGHINTSGGDLTVNSNHGFDIDHGADVRLQGGNAHINAPRVQLGDDINTTGTITGTATSVAVENSDAQIQDGLDVAASGATVTVGDGIYGENITINKALKLLSENGRDATTIEGISGAGALGTVVFAPRTSGIQLGDTDQGFTIVGIDNDAPGIENAAVYLQGAQSDHIIKDNDIVANGEAGLLSEYGAVVSDILIDGNIFSGQTFKGANPAGNGFGQQFILDNVPRQLVVMGGGTGGGNTSNITFTNNEITGTAGGLNVSAEEQGNTLVTIDADNSTITGNIFAGTTARYGTSLRARGDGTLISGNTFNAAGLTDTSGHLFVASNVYTGVAGQDNIIDIWDSNTFIGRATVSSDDTSAGSDFIGLTIGGAVASSNAGATVHANGATYAEGDINLDKNIVISGAGKTQTILDATGFTNGFIINSDLGNNNTTIRRLSVNNAANTGVLVAAAADLKVLQLNQTAFNNNGNAGVAVFGDGNDAKEVRILNSDFKNNGTNATTNKGQGDILFYEYNGDITLRNITVEGNTGSVDYGNWNGVAATADYGIQIHGDKDFAPSGTITLDNVKVSGNYRASLLGIQIFDGVDITMTDVVLGGQTTDGTDSSTGFGGALFLSELNGANVNIGNTSFLAINNKDGYTGQYIVLGSEAGSPDVDARGALFESVSGSTATLAQNFAIEGQGLP